jgi:hypothetical protein
MNTVVDPMLSSLGETLLLFVEDQLSNNEVASDDEPLACFVSNGLTGAQAIQALRYRSLYLLNIFLRDHTPIRKSKHAIRFDSNRQQYELIRC